MKYIISDRKSRWNLKFFMNFKRKSKLNQFLLFLKSSGLWKPNGDRRECGEKINLSNIVGGSITKLGEITFMALLGYEKLPGRLPGQIFYTCGASIINKWYVLTAAHCIEGNLR